MNKDNRNEAKILHYFEKDMSKLTLKKGIPFKEDEESGSFAQYTVTKKPDNNIKLKRLLLILLYIFFAIGYSTLFLVVVKIPWVLAILPGLVIVLWFFTWKYTNIEYTYVSQKNVFHVFKVNGYGKATEVFNHSISDSTIIVPANKDFEDDIKNIKIDEYKDFSSDISNSDRYLGIWNIDNKNICVYFDASSKLLSSLKYFGNDKVVVTYVSR